MQYNRVFTTRNTSPCMYEAVHKRSVRFHVILSCSATYKGYPPGKPKILCEVLEVNLPFVVR